MSKTIATKFRPNLQATLSGLISFSFGLSIFHADLGNSVNAYLLLLCTIIIGIFRLTLDFNKIIKEIMDLRHYYSQITMVNKDDTKLLTKLLQEAQKNQ